MVQKSLTALLLLLLFGLANAQIDTLKLKQSFDIEIDHNLKLADGRPVSANDLKFQVDIKDSMSNQWFFVYTQAAQGTTSVYPKSTGGLQIGKLYKLQARAIYTVNGKSSNPLESNWFTFIKDDTTVVISVPQDVLKIIVKQR